MRRMVLTRPVAVTGPDFFGRMSVLHASPANKPGWYWQTRSRIVPITAALLSRRRRRLTLEYEGERLNIIEHIACARFLGLDGIVIRCPSGWPPYDGSASALLRALRPHLHGHGSLERYTSRSSYHVSRGGNRFVRLDSTCTDGLTLDVTVDYRGIGRESFEFDMTDPSELERIFVAPTQGWPRYARIFAEIASIVGWPHKRSIWWPRKGEERETRLAFARHRALDMLGALALLCPPGGILVGRMASHKGGHALDLELVRRAALEQAPSMGLVLCP